MAIPGELTIKGYEPLEKIGEGTSGAVYRAYQPHMRREVAIKLIHPRFANQPNFIRRFDLEAHLVAQLEHLHIVPLYDYWREPEGAYLVMRLMKGGSLEKSLNKGGRWEPEQAVRLVDQISSALDAAHQQGVVHRDLKPANILLDEQGNAYLSDFGIAKELGMGKSFTQTGAIIGTPAYISPEQVQSQPITPQSDIYSLGVVIYELLVGRHPFLDTPTADLVVKHLHEPLPMVREKRPELAQEVDQVVQRATAKDPNSRYESAMKLAMDFRRALQLDVDVPEFPESEIYNPYKGLRSFQEVDVNDFYGRQGLTQQLLERLSDQGKASRFLAVVGPSGSGKSSVVNAGLVPALRAGELPGSEEWFITEMKPGAYPMEELELAILRVAIIQPPSLLVQLKEDQRGLLRAVRRVLPEGTELILVIDQLEELYSLVSDPNEINFFLESLYEAVTDPHSPLRVIITLRADYYDQPLKHPEFSSLIEQCTQVVKPLSTSELEEAICDPANRLGVTFESGLVSTIVGEVHEEPGALPILQYALTELFELRNGKVITRTAYDQIGGVRGALARRAEGIYMDLGEEGKEAARQLFLRLVTLGEGQEDTRRRVLRSEVNVLLGEKLPELIESFGMARLLTFDHDPQTREPTVEVAHEALLQEWQRLREWLAQSRADIRLQRVLGNAAEEWQSAGKDSSFLLRGIRLDQFEIWAESTDLVMTPLEGDYIQASLTERRERESIEDERLAHEARLERRSGNFLRALVGVLIVAMIIALILIGVAFNQRSIAEYNAATATFAQGMAVNEAATAVAAQEESLEMGVALSLARVAADKASRISTVNELVAFAKNEVENPSDVSYSLALLLAKHAVMISLDAGEPVTPGAQEVLRQAIEFAPVQRVSFKGHTGSVTFASWSPDGLSIATAGEDGTTRIWDTQSGEQISEFGIQSGRVTYVSWSPDGKYLLTGNSDRTVRIWEVSSGKNIITFHDHQTAVGTAIWNKDGTRILSASESEVNLWDVRSGDQLLHKILADVTSERSITPQNFAEFSPAEDQIATRDGNSILIFDTRTGEEVHRFSTQSGIPNSVDWSSDGKRLVSAHDLNSAIIWDVQTGEVIKEFKHSSRVENATWNFDESLVATVTQDGVVHLWEPQSGGILRQWQANNSPLWSVQWALDGGAILTGGEDGVARIWEIGTSKQGGPIAHLYPVTSATWNSEGTRILSVAGVWAYVWELENEYELQRFEGHSSQILGAAWEPNGERVITGDANGILIIWDSQTGRELVRMGDNPQGINSVAWSPDGRRVITGSQDRSAIVWDAQQGGEVITLRDHNGGVQSASWSPDQNLIITTSVDHTAIIWQVADGKQLVELQGHTGSVNDADWNPDGKQVVTASSDSTVRIWDVESGQEINQLIGHIGAVLSVDWVPGGEQIVTGGQDGTARIWDASTGREISRIRGHEGSIVSVHWSPDGNQILTASTDKTVRIWPVGIQGLLHQADTLILRNPPEFTPDERCLYLHECGE